MPGARWFPDAQLNFAENLLRQRDEREAIVFRGEDGARRSLTFAGLYDQVSRAAQALRAIGVEPGDRVVGYLPNVPETIVVMLAATSLGAIWSSCSPDFGVSGAVERFSLIEPAVLFGTDGYRYAGKPHWCLERLAQVRELLPTVRQVVVVPFLDSDPDCSVIRDAVPLDEFTRPFEPAGMRFEQLPFDHPVYIMFSSGTTGAPKCLVHGAGGTLLQHLKELMLHTDITLHDRLFYYTTCGWMMWNWQVSALACGATLLLYDGSPVHPSPAALFDYADKESMTVFGTSAKFIDAVRQSGLEPVRTHRLSSLRTILSTGSPLAPESFDFVYGHIKRDVCLSSISGGTDIISCFALGNPLLPVRRGQLQCRGLGMKVEVFADDGRSIRGAPGELVCTAPFPSMPVGFWNDSGDAKYREAYFGRFPGVWCHGDWVELTEDEGLVIYGRSDAVLNPGGVRIGTAEIYRQVEHLPEVVEALAIGQRWKSDERIVLFVRLSEGRMLDADLKTRIRTRIREGASARHVPAKIVQVGDIPRTRNGKIAELAVRNVVHRLPVKNLEALANPEALLLFADLPELAES